MTKEEKKSVENRIRSGFSHFADCLTYHVGLDGAVGGGVGDAGEGEAGAHLVVVEEGLVGLVDRASLRRSSRGGERERRGASVAGFTRGDAVVSSGGPRALLGRSREKPIDVVTDE